MGSNIARYRLWKRLLWVVPGDPQEAAFWQQDRWICKHRQIFMMHIKQLASNDLCRSPTYSLLCSLSISVPQGQAALKDAIATTAQSSLTKSCDCGGRWLLQTAVSLAALRAHFLLLWCLFVHSAPTRSSLASLHEPALKITLHKHLNKKRDEKEKWKNEEEKALTIISIILLGCFLSRWSQNKWNC